MAYGRIGDDVDEEMEVLAGMTDGLGPFTDSSNAQLYPIRELRLFRERTELMNDDRMDAAEREQRIAEIDEELAVLQVLQANQ